MSATAASRALFVTAALAAAAASAAENAPLPVARPPATKAVSEPEAVRRALVALDVTHQDFKWDEPWRKRPPATRSGYGVVVAGGRVLTTARMVQGATLVELRRASEQTPWAARVAVIDHVANLALVEPEDAKFFEGLAPLPFGGAPADPDEQAKVTVYRYRGGRRLDAIAGTVSEVDASRVGVGHAQLLTFGVNLSTDGGGWGEAIVADGKLAGLAWTRVSNRVYGLAAPVLAAWVADVASGARRGFASDGWSWQSLTNAELRAHLGVPKGREGILLTKVPPYATGAGVLKDGDVLLSLAGRAIDARGSFEHAVYGPVRFTLLINDGHLAGDELDAEIVRGGEVRKVRVKLAPEQPNRRSLASHLASGRPRYVVYSGLVFQELSAPYLGALGENALVRLSIQADLTGDRAIEEVGRSVVLTQVLPDPVTTGYESIRNRLVSKVNGRPVRSLEDVAASVAEASAAFHTVEFVDGQDQLVLEAAGAKAAHPRILEAYRIVPERNLDSKW